ncbi:MAG: hypothetical protein QOC38_10490 [Nitrososphaeraceae archaeon]|jgi:hypothetical protein|nr:hypothetical protein [Nitrososphaeraceae archaeon]MDW0203621.1 hypothetical protein [Nitrososphaeraceae archaeon]MDW0245620.1 hypothetical protein [Nitrososphaeraceae archaeon]MDW0278379.1 hypothetical protein [Nitrososphaeraceae archaeon]
MRLVCFGFTGMFIIGFAFAIPLFLTDLASAQNQNQNQNLTPSMVINMSDLSIKVGNTTSNETLTFSNNTTNQSGNSSS